ncbi:MAG: 50S ribosomal protein L21 [bacterium]|nr:50S ribosomal protein L21 [bacterium]
MFAIVRIAGKQYKVSKGDLLEVNRLASSDGESLKFDDVLLMSDENGKTDVGTPRVTGASVTGKIVKTRKTKKIEVRRFKSKVRYRRKIGFRPYSTEVEILSVDRA